MGESFLYKTCDFPACSEASAGRHCLSMSNAVILNDFHCLPLLKQWGYNPSMFNFQFSMKNEDCLFSPLYSLPACVRERGETALAERGS
jgi:hypothetical protein